MRNAKCELRNDERCGACGCRANERDLQRAALPTPVALAAFMIWPRAYRGIVRHDFADHASYCPACRRRVNLRRAFAFLMIVLVPILLARLIIPWMIYFFLPGRF
jgi:hypothetical protein